MVGAYRLPGFGGLEGVDERLDFMGAVVIALIAVAGVPLALLVKGQRTEEQVQRIPAEKIEKL